MIDVTKVDKVALVMKVYELSRPQGLGMMEYTPGPLPIEEAMALVMGDGTVSLDYVRGRACKFSIYKRGDRFVTDDKWFDHTDEQFSQLLDSVGLKRVKEEHPDPDAHAKSCNCDVCRVARGEGKLDAEADFKNAQQSHLKIMGMKFPKEDD